MKNDALTDELLAIDSIYPECMSRSEGSDNTYIVRVPETAVHFFLSFDTHYPISRPRLSAVTGIDRTLLDQCLQESSGTEVLFSLISVVQDAQTESINTRDENFSREEEEEEEEEASNGAEESHVVWSVGEPIHDRKSTMLGRACRVTSKEELYAALKNVEQDKKLQKASHPCIWACRFTSAQGILIQENDDDGETAAGSRLAFLLDVTRAENVLVVVSRWFGGVLLGDVRFKHISTAARDALERGGFLTLHESGDQTSKSKKGKR